MREARAEGAHAADVAKTRRLGVAECTSGVGLLARGRPSHGSERLTSVCAKALDMLRPKSDRLGDTGASYWPGPGPVKALRSSNRRLS